MQGEADEGMEILEQAKQERVGLSMMGFMYWPDIVYGIGLVSLATWRRHRVAADNAPAFS